MMSSEKNDSFSLPRPVAGSSRQGTTNGTARKICFGILSLVAIISLHYRHHVVSGLPDLSNGGAKSALEQCPQVDPLMPNITSTKLKEMEIYMSSPSYRNQSTTRLSQLVQIPSISYDNMGAADEDERFEIFYTVEKYLQAAYPLVHSVLKKETVNTHGFLYTWEGSDKSLKPTLLMAHQDVVPVEKSTINSWTHPPFSGLYDGKFVWGRGASDCKNQLTGILEAVELLLAADFQPKRTVLLSFGFDEEVSGKRGAGHLAPFIEERYGKDSVAAIVDEGAGVTEAWGGVFSAPAVAEKGYTDVEVVIRMPGGHSSIPSPHTSIGVLSYFITLVEEEQYTTFLDDKNPFLGALRCGAQYSPDFPHKLRHLLEKRDKHSSTCKKRGDALAEEAAKEGLGTRYLMQTSQAVDLISGGAKVNALPERVSATINHRINIGERPRDAEARLTHLAKKVAAKYDLTLHAFDGAEESANSIFLSASNTTLEPAPVTPTTIYEESGDLSPYGILSGSTRALYGTEINMTPGLSTGNTDTRYYWDLTKHIFRYGPGYDVDGDAGLGNIHTVNERQSVVAHINTVKWMSLFIRNMDEAKLA